MNARTLKQQLKYKIPQLKLALIREPQSAPMPQINTPQDFEPYLAPMRCLSEENFVAFHLNPRNQVIGYHLVSQGTVSASLVHPREVFKAALLSNAYSILVAHNHPSGNSSPSPDDLDTSSIIVQAARIMNIHILDHLIVTDSDIYSIREHYPNLFELPI